MNNTSVGIEGEYSEIADQQLDNLEERDPTLYNDVLAVCEAIFPYP